METISESSLIVDEDSIHRYEFICYIEGDISDWYCSEYVEQTNMPYSN